MELSYRLSYHLWNLSPGPIETTPKLVLLHGMGGTGALWRPIAASLESEMAVLAPDQRGHGQSQHRFLTYTPLDYGQDLVNSLKALDWHSVWILGHSMGVRTAVAAAHLNPTAVRGLILVDLGFSGAAGGGLGDDLATFLKKMPSTFSSREEAKDFMLQHCPDPSIAQYLMAVSVRDAQGGLSFPFDQRALIQTIEAAKESSVREWLQELGERQMPILVLRGEKSLVWSQQEYEAEKAHFQAYPSIQFEVVAGAGHGLPFEKRAVMLQWIRDWMSR